MPGFKQYGIEDQAPRFVGPDLDPYCLKRSFKINVFLENVKKKIILFNNFWRALYLVLQTTQELISYERVAVMVELL